MKYRSLEHATRTNKREYLTEAEYLKLEEISAIRHEYIDGRVYAMTGASRRHSDIQGNIFADLHVLLDGGACRVYMENRKVKITEANCYYYPDIMVVCQDAKYELHEDSPVLIMEILSRSSSSIDRREKFNNYTKLQSLQEYILVHQQRRRVELFRRTQGEEWDECIFQDSDSVILKSLPCELNLSMDRIYRNCNLSDGTQLTVKEELADYVLSEHDLYELSW